MKDSDFKIEYKVSDFIQSFENHKIMKISSEKRECIISVAMEEFTNGFRKANTDIIAQKSGISKGTLFNYFVSKKELFLFLIKYSIEIINKEYVKEDFKSDDFLENIWKLNVINIELHFKYQKLYKFLNSAIFSLKEEFPELSTEDYENPINELIEIFTKNMNLSLFKKDINIEMAKNIILWTVNGFTEKLFLLDINEENYNEMYDKTTNELREYIILLWKTFYKKSMGNR